MITSDMLINEILEINPDIAAILMQRGMHCIGCMAASGESLREACYVHGFDDDAVEELVAQLNDFVGAGA